MARFSIAFGLCSITDSKGLLGVTGDDEGCAVVTLGKSMVIRCRLSDQKQLNSWSTTLAKLTSKVVWNAIDENYVGVFDNVYIKQWKKTESSLEKTKKHKFKNEIHEILLYAPRNILKKPELVILFKNGSIRDLESGLINCKETMPDVIQPQETIEGAKIIDENDKKHLIIVTKFENKYRQCYCVQLEEDNFIVSENVKKIKLRRQGTSLLGYIILTGEKGNSVLTLWSDGFLYALPLPLESEKPGVGSYLGAINVISKNCEVAMQALSGDHVGIYGADPSEEGAFLGMYNIKFGIIQARTNFKMFNKPPRLWLIDNNLVTVVGQRLICVPFNLQTETLSALVGSRALFADLKTSSEICTIIPTAVWDDNLPKDLVKEQVVEYPDKIKEQLLAFSSEGWSEYGICQALMTHLIEAKDIKTLFWCLNNFTDIPEDHLVRMTQLALKESDIFKNVTEEELPEVDSKTQFLNKILTTPVNNHNLLKNFRQLFTFEDCLLLVGYFSDLFSHDVSHRDVPLKNSETVLEWAMVLLDAFYQHFVLSRDSKTLELLVLLKEIIDENILYVNELKNIVPFILRIAKGKPVEKRTKHSETYSVERFQLYD